MYFYNKHNIVKKDVDSVVKSLKQNFITKGKFLSLFEKKLKDFFKSKYCLVFSNGTMALFSIAKALSWNENSHIILSPISFVAGANSVVNSNSNLHFADIDKYFCLDPYETEKKIIELKKKKKRVSAIIVTDYGGNPANWKKFYKIKKKYKLILINDNCHSIGSKYNNSYKYATKFADIVVHSYHAVKNITTGEGGSILTNNKKIYEKLKLIREHGFIKKKLTFPWSYDLDFEGYNARLSEMNCALGFSQLDRIEEIIKERNKLANRYNKIFSKIEGIKIPPSPSPGTLCSYHLYPLRFDWKRLGIKKIDLYEKLKKKFHIQLQVHYVPTYKFSYFKKKFKFSKTKLLNTEKFYEEAFSIPIFIGMKNKDILYISKAIIKSISNLK